MSRSSFLVLRPRVVLSLFAALLLSSCATTSFYEPAIVDISDSKVVVQREHSDPLSQIYSKNTATVEDAIRVANEGCGQYNKKAKLLSNSCARIDYTEFLGNSCGATKYLFSCVDE